jgi:hypothetical protein
MAANDATVPINNATLKGPGERSKAPLKSTRSTTA